ncbi:hypothetical protein OF83DRAFT_1180738 [Amylostereum chailletii]|nr:hypothetical protein OF83DRAFT_1180738 [Amylostereum chailletii]
MLGYAAPLFERIPATSGNNVTTVVVTRYPHGPLYTLIALLYLYALCALLLCLLCFLPSRRISTEKGRHVIEDGSMVELAHLRLTNPLASVVDRFGTTEATHSLLMTSTVDLLKEGEGTASHRLAVGFVREDGHFQPRYRPQRFRVDEDRTIEKEYTKGP